MSLQALERLEQLLLQLNDDAKTVDQENKQKKSHYYLQQDSLFDQKLFPIVSSNYADYVQYTLKQLTQLKRLEQSNKTILESSLLETLDQQISSLITAIKSNSARHHDSDYRLQRRYRLQAQKQVQQNKYQHIAKGLMKGSHQLHAKLAETRGFEKRLMQMLFDKETELNQCKANQQSELQQQVLILHQRLGRCRKAISQLERELELAEKNAF
ncbi:primosomal replication protein PriC [Thalassotalea aquiviva]|uniref:primosomal replication protein PriC n=1 Tax=Thalassotalea aquiviva TaxID=3242415 RepID=UPI00352B529D